MNYQQHFRQPPPGFLPDQQTAPYSNTMPTQYRMPPYRVPPPVAGTSSMVARTDFSTPPPVPIYSAPPPNYSTNNYRPDYSIPPNYQTQPLQNYYPTIQQHQSHIPYTRQPPPPSPRPHGTYTPPPPGTFTPPLPPPPGTSYNVPPPQIPPAYRRNTPAPIKHGLNRNTYSSSSDAQLAGSSGLRNKYLSSQHTSRNNDRRDRDKQSSSVTNSEREELLSKWRSNFCEHYDDITRKLAELENHEEKEVWIRSSPSDIYYTRSEGNIVESTARLNALCKFFEEELVNRTAKIRETQAPYTTPPRKRKHKVCRHKCNYS